MSHLVNELTLDQVDEWFKIGQNNYKDVQTIEKSTTAGRLFDVEKQKPRVQSVPYIPDYHRHPRDDSQTDYAVQYQQQEQAQLMKNPYHDLHEQDRLEDTVSEISQLDLNSICTSAAPLAANVEPPNANDVYKNYAFHPQYDPHLPITRYHDKVIASIDINQVTVIQGSTGSGKSTQVPQYILDHYAQQNKYCNIVVTQPRKIAAISLSRRVCQERGWELGTICGYQIGMDKQTSEDTRISYVTTGVLLRRLIANKNMVQYTHVILDEVHERDQDTDFCLLVVRKLLRTNSPQVKVVLMSATIESGLFTQYFARPIFGELAPAPVISVEGRVFNVSEYYTNDLAVLGDIPPLDQCNPKITEEAFCMAIRLIQEFDNLEAKDQKIDSTTGFAPFRGTVLVFLPGLAEIDNMYKNLQEKCLKNQLVLIPLHSTITADEQIRVFEMPEKGKRKVILSTNIAESSITVPDIKYVIDFCLTKNLISDPDTNYTSLQMEWASKANCNQRKGRAGRVSNGRVYRMITHYFWENYIQDYGIPEMQRCPLEKLILDVKLLDFEEPKAVLALALSPPNLDDIERTILLLKEVGALCTPPNDHHNRYDGDITFVGRVLAELPVDIRIGKLILFGYVLGLLQECLIIAAALSLKTIFATPYRKNLEAYRHKLNWGRGSQSDCIAVLNAYCEWQRRKEMGEFKRKSQKESEWARNNFLQLRRLYEVAELVRELEGRLYHFNIQKPPRKPNYKKKLTEDQERLLLKIVIAGAFYPNYFIKEPIDEEEADRMMSGHDAFNTVMVKGLPANQGVLYKGPVEDLFRTVGFKPTAYFEETKAFISFKKTQDQEGKVHPGVYMAIKWRLMRLPLELNLFTVEEAKKLLAKQEQAINDQQGAKSLRTNRLTLSDQFNKETLLLPPPSAQSVVITVTEVMECGHFYAQYREDANFRQLLQIQMKLNQFKGKSLQPLVGLLTDKEGLLCAAPYVDETHDYYRGRLEEIKRIPIPHLHTWQERVKIFFVDYGNTEEIPREELRELPSELADIPYQAVECELCNIRPSAIKCPDGKWTFEATQKFRVMVNNKELFGEIFSVVRNVIRMKLIEPCAFERQICYNDQLIRMGYADYAEEGYLSKKSNEERMEYKYRDYDKKAGNDPFQDQRNGWLKLDSSLNMLPSGDHRKGGKVHLRGPHNPYEMSFLSMTSVGRLRSVKVDPGSINCIALDDEPQDPHDRVMVASFVGLNPSGSSMIARDTTIMPLIPGLPALLSLLFAPVAEFRADKKLTKIIGAICGLGTKRTSDHPAFPDHDMEIIFDSKIDVEDMYKINGIRMAINICIGTQEAVLSWGPDAMFKMQENLRQKILNLLQKRREHIEPVSFERPYRWKQVREEDIVYHSLEGTEADCPVLFNLHNSICINDPDDDDDTSSLFSGASSVRQMPTCVSSPSTVVPISKKTKEKMKTHVKFLRQAAKNFSSKDPIMCELCNVTAATPQLLMCHLDLRRHRENERILFEED